jgi:hypothetical protein
MSFFIRIHNFPVDKKTAGQVSGNSEDFGTDQAGRLLNCFQQLKQCYYLKALNMQL